MNWEKFILDTLHQMGSWGGSLMATFGLGGGVGLVKLLNHWPAPYEGNAYGGAIFDTLQDLVSNKRVGDRRTRNGATVPAVPVMDLIPNPTPAPVPDKPAEPAKEQQ